jgi:hypothetical protein
MAVGSMAQMDPCSDAAAASYERQDYPQGVDNWKFTWNEATNQEARCVSCVEEYTPMGGYTGLKNRIGKCGAKDPDTCDFDTGGIPREDRPNGFRMAQIAMDNEPPFCLTVEGSRNANVMVLIETFTANQRICVKTRSNGIALNEQGVLPPQCDEGQVTGCFPSDSNKAALELLVYCDESCPEGPIPFYYKIDHSMTRSHFNSDAVAQDSAVKSVDMWCTMQAGQPEMKWPSELGRDSPPGFVPKTYVASLNGASSTGPVAGAVALLAGTAMALLY